jgi:hypothetical protein
MTSNNPQRKQTIVVEVLQVRAERADLAPATISTDEKATAIPIAAPRRPAWSAASSTKR